MKKTLLLLSSVLVLLPIGCDNEPVTEHSNEENSQQTTFNPDLPVSNENWPDNLARHVPGSVVLQPVEWLADEFFMNTFTPRHRLVFYPIDGLFSNLVNWYEYRAWSEAFWADTDGSREEMALMHFVLYFDIQKEDFVAVVERLREIREDQANRWGLDLFLEEYELPNADIIFTFDPEIISYFYRRE